jgi:hypothetical protein
VGWLRNNDSALPGFHDNHTSGGHQTSSFPLGIDVRITGVVVRLLPKLSEFFLRDRAFARVVP